MSVPMFPVFTLNCWDWWQAANQGHMSVFLVVVFCFLFSRQGPPVTLTDLDFTEVHLPPKVLNFYFLDFSMRRPHQVINSALAFWDLGFHVCATMPDY